MENYGAKTMEMRADLNYPQPCGRAILVGLKAWNFSDTHSAGDINAEDETTVIVNNAEL